MDTPPNPTIIDVLAHLHPLTQHDDEDVAFPDDLEGWTLDELKVEVRRLRGVIAEANLPRVSRGKRKRVEVDGRERDLEGDKGERGARRAGEGGRGREKEENRMTGERGEKGARDEGTGKRVERGRRTELGKAVRAKVSLERLFSDGSTSSLFVAMPLDRCTSHHWRATRLVHLGPRISFSITALLRGIPAILVHHWPSPPFISRIRPINHRYRSPYEHPLFAVTHS